MAPCCQSSMLLTTGICWAKQACLSELLGSAGVSGSCVCLGCWLKFGSQQGVQLQQLWMQEASKTPPGRRPLEGELSGMRLSKRVLKSEITKAACADAKCPKACSEAPRGQEYSVRSYSRMLPFCQWLCAARSGSQISSKDHEITSARWLFT